MRSVRRTRRPLLALALLIALLVIGYVVRAVDPGSDGPGGGSGASASSASSTVPSSGARESSASAGVALSSLPSQVADTVRLIRAGGPFRYPRNDGATFHNNERTLPRQSDGYYREYTVPTPGSPDRGPRRVVTGRNGQFYYTADHYASFRLIDVTR